MITFEQFKTKWIGKGINFDGAYGNQCMDVYRQYVKECLGCPQSPVVTGAKNVWNTYLKDYFDRITNDPNDLTLMPQNGDIVIWNVGNYGHIAVCESATGTTLTCFEQNWTEGDGSGVSEIRKHSNYNGVLGWLRFKKQETDIMMTEEQKRIWLIVKDMTEGKIREAMGALADVPGLKQKISDQSKQIEDLTNQMDEIKKQLEDLTTKFSENEKSLTSCQKELKTANQTISNITVERDALAVERTNYKKWYESKCEELKKLDKMTAWQHIKYGINLLVNQKK